MTVINFTKEAKKRNKTFKTPPPVTQKEEEIALIKDHRIFKGEYSHNEDKALITVEPDIDKVTIDLYDVSTGEQYYKFCFDSYTLFLITQATTRMFKELDEVLN